MNNYKIKEIKIAIGALEKAKFYGELRNELIKRLIVHYMLEENYEATEFWKKRKKQTNN